MSTVQRHGGYGCPLSWLFNGGQHYEDIMSKLTEILDAQAAHFQKVHDEVAALAASNSALQTSFAELKAALDNRDLTVEEQAALDAHEAQLQAIDDLIPDAQAAETA